MKFILKVCAGGVMTKFENPSPELIEHAIETIRPMYDNFIILDPEDLLEDCRFMQTAISLKKDTTVLEYIVELQFAYGEAEIAKGKLFTQYQTLVGDVSVVKRLFRMFALGIVPDCRTWNDITQDMLDEWAEQRKAREAEK
ncbi:MAG: hypothetical protein LBD82_08445 [Deltaproteobacteria bacterium]|nr:hypothetical protein [Deltaproteobacteria bacterium]